MVDDECRAVCGISGSGNRSTRIKPATVLLCPPEIAQDLNWTRTLAVAVGDWRLNARTTARTGMLLTKNVKHKSNFALMCLCNANRIDLYVVCGLSLFSCVPKGRPGHTVTPGTQDSTNTTTLQRH
jgi:hypothetical protein